MLLHLKIYPYPSQILLIMFIPHNSHNRRWCTFFKPAYLFPQRTRKGLLLKNKTPSMSNKTSSTPNKTQNMPNKTQSTPNKTPSTPSTPSISRFPCCISFIFVTLVFVIQIHIFHFNFFNRDQEKIAYLVFCLVYLVFCLAYFVFCLAYLVFCLAYLVFCLAYLVFWLAYLVFVWRTYFLFGVLGVWCMWCFVWLHYVF